MESYRNGDNLLYLQSTRLKMYHENMLFLPFSLPRLQSPQMEIAHSSDLMLNSDGHSRLQKASAFVNSFPLFCNWTAQISRMLSLADILFVTLCSKNTVSIVNRLPLERSLPKSAHRSLMTGSLPRPSLSLSPHAPRPS